MAEARARPTTSRIAAVDIFHDFGDAETAWRDLEHQNHFSTPYQRFDLLAPWHRQVGTRKNLSPLIVVAYDTERRPLLLLPLVLQRGWGFRVAGFMGGKHANFNMALWDGEFAAVATSADLDVLMEALGARSGADVLALNQQPRFWRDLPNPLALLPNQASANTCPLMTMTPGAPPTTLMSNSFRRRLKSKERKLHTLPGYRYGVAKSDAEIVRHLDAFFHIKPLRMAEQKLPNVFAEPGVEDFIREACLTSLANGNRVIDIHVLECDEELIAIFAGVADGHRFSMMFNTYTMSASARHSPGLILIRHIVDHYAALGYRALDLGIGSDDYKKLFCKSEEPIFDCFISLSRPGRVAAAAMSLFTRVKRVVKYNRALFNLAQRLLGALR